MIFKKGIQRGWYRRGWLIPHVLQRWGPQTPPHRQRPLPLVQPVGVHRGHILWGHDIPGKHHFTIVIYSKEHGTPQEAKKTSVEVIFRRFNKKSTVDNSACFKSNLFHPFIAHKIISRRLTAAWTPTRAPCWLGWPRSSGRLWGLPTWPRSSGESMPSSKWGWHSFLVVVTQRK